MLSCFYSPQRISKPFLARHIYVNSINRNALKNGCKFQNTCKLRKFLYVFARQSSNNSTSSSSRTVERTKFYRSTVLIKRKPESDQWFESSLDDCSSSILSEGAQEENGFANIISVPKFQILGAGKITEWWEGLPARWKMIYTITLAFVLCNMDKVNMSVAVIPMAQEFGWTSSLIGSVSGFFFYGYMLAQYPGGLLARKLGGQNVLPIGVGLWSLSTVAVPLMAGAVPTLFLSRSLVGLGEAVAPSAQNDIVAKIVPQNERARANSTIFGGLYLGSIVGLFIAPRLIEIYDWPSVFFVFGGAGLVWCIMWQSLLNDLKQTDPELISKIIPKNSQQLSQNSPKFQTNNQSEEQTDLLQSIRQQYNNIIYELKETFTDVPLQAFLQDRSVQALLYVHFCNNWFHYTFLSWLPKYFTDTLDSNLSIAAFYAALPSIAALTFSFFVGPSADYLISKNISVTKVRKLYQSIAFLGPLSCLGGVWYSDGEIYGTVGGITLAFGLGSFVLAGLYCNHQDISPKYSQVLLGLTNTLGAVPGVFGAALTGILMDQYGDYNIALLMPAMFFFLSGTIVYILYGSSQPVDFDAKQKEILKNHEQF
eukprot:TRINITY_DN3614_c0_g1_i2.p1 TRINITY_DN3614_c0_g1~~TRINITY_DN3614_c0_g1_i2.p1  ORF type:complete len:595 (-),score=64.43 TRINITY_DN3614_c0_g1_i2:1307-3091(-)